MISPPRLSARHTERAVQELLYVWVSKYFNGQPHISKLGEVTFPLVDVLFNQTQVDNPSGRAQIHFIFTDFRPHETWFANGNLSVWKTMLANPFSGVSYGATQVATIEESIHGKRARTLRGTNIRWQAREDGLHEQVFASGVWRDERVFPDALAIRWQRIGGSYVEQVQVGPDWIAQRTITVQNPLWDGTKKLVVIETMITAFVRAVTEGQTFEEADFACRDVADNLHEMFLDETIRAELTQKGFRRIAIARGPTPMASSGTQTRMMILQASLRYFIPREH